MDIAKESVRMGTVSFTNVSFTNVSFADGESTVISLPCLFSMRDVREERFVGDCGFAVIFAGGLGACGCTVRLPELRLYGNS